MIDMERLNQLLWLDYELWPEFQIDWETLKVVKRNTYIRREYPEGDNWAGSPEQAWA